MAVASDYILLKCNAHSLYIFMFGTNHGLPLAMPLEFRNPPKTKIKTKLDRVVFCELRALTHLNRTYTDTHTQYPTKNLIFINFEWHAVNATYNRTLKTNVRLGRRCQTNPGFWFHQVWKTYENSYKIIINSIRWSAIAFSPKNREKKTKTMIKLNDRSNRFYNRPWLCLMRLGNDSTW